MYMLFDASPSSSALIREGYRETALLMGLDFCNRFRSNGEIELNAITAEPDQDSVLETVACPHGVNETDQKAQDINFQHTFGAAVDQVIAYQANDVGTDIAGASLYAAKQTFDEFQPKHRYLILFSDMQQSGGGVRNCILKEGYKASSCVTRYFGENPQYPRAGELTGTEVYVSGAGRNIRGRVTKLEWQADTSFWRAFFNTEGARVCWYAATSVPVQVQSDGTKVLDSHYFNDHCSPAL